jgi:ribosome-associated toxin RatA of RatAB toxin-antitoxin module
LTFTYLSRVSYTHPALPIKIKEPQEWRIGNNSPQSAIFNSLESQWIIRNTAMNECLIDYRIQMEFASPMMAAVTRQLFDYLVSNVNEQFE